VETAKLLPHIDIGNADCRITLKEGCILHKKGSEKREKRGIQEKREIKEIYG